MQRVVRRAVSLGMVLALAAGCGDDGSGAQHDGPVAVEEVSSPGPGGGLVAVDDVLLAPPDSPGQAEATGEALYRSEDGGRSWEAVGLPGVPTDFTPDVESPRLVGEAAVVTGQGHAGPNGYGAFAWVSDDGQDWRGGRLGAAPLPFRDVTVHAADGILVAGAVEGRNGGGGVYRLYRSEDGGATWEQAEVATGLSVANGGRMSLSGVREDGDRLVADLDLGVLSPDGETGGNAPTADGPGTASVGPGGEMVTSGGSAEPGAAGVEAVLESDDGGATWRVGRCPDVAVADYGDCELPRAYGDGDLLVRFDEVSVDGGHTWQAPTLRDDEGSGGGDGDGTHREHRVRRFRSVVELPGGGWLATGTAMPFTDVDVGYLLHSSDGLRWEMLGPSAECDGGVTAEWFSDPVPLGGDLLVTYSCRQDFELAFGEAYLVEPDGSAAAPVPGSRRDDATYVSAATAGDVVVAGVVPEEDGPATFVRFTR